MNDLDDARLEITAKLFYRTILTRVITPGLAELPEEKLTYVQLACMRYAYLHPEPSVGEIADGLNISDAASAKLIDRLVKRFLLIREEDPDDRRVLKIKLTDKGLIILKSLRETESHNFTTIIRKMSPGSVNALEQGLAAFLSAALGKPEEIEEACLRCGWEHSLDCPGNIRYRELTGEDKRNV